MKKIILASFAFVSMLFASNQSIYMDENKMDYSDIRPFVGLDAGYGYINGDVKTGDGLDNTEYSYSGYIGLPILSYEIIFKEKKKLTSDFNIKEHSFIINRSIDGSGARMVYLGLIGGKGELTWSNNRISSLNINNKTVKDNFFGIHLGKQYKFTRNFYVRIELEYMKYKYQTTNNTANLDKSLEFIYGVEYRF